MYIYVYIQKHIWTCIAKAEAQSEAEHSAYRAFQQFYKINIFLAATLQIKAMAIEVENWFVEGSSQIL